MSPFEKLNYAFRREGLHVAIELILLLFIAVYLLNKRAFKPKTIKPLSLEEKEELIAEWRPETLAREKYYLKDKSAGRGAVVVESETGPFLFTNHGRLVNFSSSSFLGLSGNKEIKKKALSTIRKFGVGSCGPRGFYGTTPLHTSLEKSIAEHFGAEDCIVYSDVSGCVSSLISAFSKKGDIIFCDKGCSYFAKLGAKVSRSRVYFFENNDLKNLECIVTEVVKEERRSKRKLTNRFIVTEGLSGNYGTVCNLRALVDLKKRMGLRLILDDSLSIGVLSPTGSLGHCNVKLAEVDIYCGNLQSFGASAAFFVGRKRLCFYQTLAGSGYCFSASAPPFLCAAAETALKVSKNQPKLYEKLKENCIFFNNLVKEEFENKSEDFYFDGSENSPIFHLRRAIFREEGVEDRLEVLKRVRFKLIERQFLVELSRGAEGEVFPPEPSLKIFLNALHEKRYLSSLVDTLKRCIEKIKVK